jgi:hypothetical protein
MKLVWYLVLIMALLVLSIGFLQNIMELLVDVLNPLNESSGFVSIRLNMGILFMCGYKRHCNINGTQQLESQTHLKCVMASGVMESSIVVVMNIGKTLIECMHMFKIVHG